VFDPKPFGAGGREEDDGPTFLQTVSVLDEHGNHFAGQFEVNDKLYQGMQVVQVPIERQPDAVVFLFVDGRRTPPAVRVVLAILKGVAADYGLRIAFAIILYVCVLGEGALSARESAFCPKPSARTSCVNKCVPAISEDFTSPWLDIARWI
jgi:hypothetical protein